MTHSRRDNKPNRVGEPVQVYLSDRDRALLEQLAKKTALPRSEIIRVALRRMASDLPGVTKSGTGLDALLGALDEAAAVPTDLSARHDEYLYEKKPPRKAVARGARVARVARKK